MTTHVLTDAEYAVVTESLVRMAGLVFDVSRRGAISAIVHERMDKTGHTSTGSYLTHVESTLGAVERQQLLDAVTIQETHFFRNLPQVEALRRDVLPDLLRRKPQHGSAPDDLVGGLLDGRGALHPGHADRSALRGDRPLPGQDHRN